MGEFNSKLVVSCSVFDACIYWFTKFENGRTLFLRSRYLHFIFFSFPAIFSMCVVGRDKGSYGAIKGVEEGEKNIIKKFETSNQAVFFFFSSLLTISST